MIILYIPFDGQNFPIQTPPQSLGSSHFPPIPAIHQVLARRIKHAGSIVSTSSIVQWELAYLWAHERRGFGNEFEAGAAWGFGDYRDEH